MSALIRSLDWSRTRLGPIRLLAHGAGFAMHLVKPVNLSVSERVLCGEAFADER